MMINEPPGPFLVTPLVALTSGGLYDNSTEGQPGLSAESLDWPERYVTPGAPLYVVSSMSPPGLSGTGCAFVWG